MATARKQAARPCMQNIFPLQAIPTPARTYAREEGMDERVEQLDLAML